MSIQTTNYGLIKPQATDPIDLLVTNPNWDTIDAKLKEASESGGTRVVAQPEEPTDTSVLWIDTDDNTVDDIAAGNTVDATLLAANWTGSESPYTYTLAVDGVTATSDQEVLPALNITKTQLEVLQNANIQDGGQATGSITLKAFGEVPVIDIPIRVVIRGGN